MNRPSIAVLSLALLLSRPAFAEAPQRPSPASSRPARAPARSTIDMNSGLDFLLGEWVSADPAVQGEARFTLKPELGAHVLVRQHHAMIPSPDKGAPPVAHDDLMVFYREAGTLKADYWDNEGHIIHYLVETSYKGITLESVEAPGPRFKLEYKIKAADLVTVVFSMKMPGAADYKVYVSGDAKRVK
jgi:hypothetical protein